MAFSKIDGLAVTPRSESSRTIRSSSPESIRLRRIWSSQMLTPASVRAASRSFTPCATLIRRLLSPGGALDCGLRLFHHPFGREAEVLEERLVRCRGTECLHSDHAAQVAGEPLPAERRGGLHGHARPHVGQQHLVPVAVVLLEEAL